MLLIPAQQPGPRQAGLRGGMGRCGGSPRQVDVALRPHLASVGREHKQLFNGFASGAWPPALSPCWRSRLSYHGSSSTSNSSTTLSASISAGSPGGSGARCRRPASAAAPGSPPVPASSARAALGRDAPPRRRSRAARAPPLPRTGLLIRVLRPNGPSGRQPGASTPAGRRPEPAAHAAAAPNVALWQQLPGRGLHSNPGRRLRQSRAGRRPRSSDVVQWRLPAGPRFARCRGQAANGHSGGNKEGGEREGVRPQAPPSCVGSRLGARSRAGVWRWRPARRLWWVCGRGDSQWSGCVGVRVGVRPPSVGCCRWASLVQAGARRVPGSRGARPCDPFWSLDPPGALSLMRGN